ncbi:MAG: iron(III) transport system substrate-binding protein [Paracoccaceae bacterium]|jgi:iron(III) transport system substrate-binding protein
MRHLILSLALICLSPLAAAGFDIEDQRLFGAGNGAVVKIISTTDVGFFAPIITAFLDENPTLSVDYVTVSTAELMRAIHTEHAAFDVAVSSAMDLQTKIANDGLARAHRSDMTDVLPDWARWRDHVFAFTQEPATIVVNKSLFDGLAIPQSRQELISVLRDHPDRFRDRVGTYDLRSSGLGYLFATQDARTSETFWRLAEVMGALGIHLYCCSSEMIDDVAAGRIAVAYNVLGSYAQVRRDVQDQIAIIQPRDFTTVMLRTALIPAASQQPDLAGLFVDHLIRVTWTGNPPDNARFPRIEPLTLHKNAAQRPIRLGPGLLVYLDRLKRAAFLRAWESAILQR